MAKPKIRGPNIKYAPEVIERMESIAELKGVPRNQVYEEALYIYIMNFNRSQKPIQKKNWVDKWKD